MRNLRLIPLTLLLALSAALGGPQGARRPSAVHEGRGAKVGERPGNERVETAPKPVGPHESFRTALRDGDAQAAASRLGELEKEWTYGGETHRRVVSELQERIRNQGSRESQAPWIAMEKFAVFDTVDLVTVDGVLKSEIKLDELSLGTPSQSDIGWMTIYATGDTGLSSSDPGPDLRRAVMAGRSSGRLSVRTQMHQDLATATPDGVVIKNDGEELQLRRVTEEHFDWRYPAAKCADCRVLLVAPGGQ